MCLRAILAARVSRSAVMSSRRVALHALLALLLVFSQQRAILHALSHGLGVVAQTHGTPHEQSCDECVAFAGLDSAAANWDSIPPPAWGAKELPGIAVVLESDRDPDLAYLSRAPPLVS